jgi:steroid 5-alpha reductase family enzyme
MLQGTAALGRQQGRVAALLLLMLQGVHAALLSLPISAAAAAAAAAAGMVQMVRLDLLPAAAAVRCSAAAARVQSHA